MENKRRLTRGSSTNHEWEKPSGCRRWDEYSKHSSPQLFRFFSRFPPSIRQETPLLVYLDPLDCIDPRIFTCKVSWFLAFIFIVLCSTFQYGCSDFGFFEWYNLKWDSFAWSCLDWSTFHKTLKKKYWSSIRPLAPVTVFEPYKTTTTTATGTSKNNMFLKWAKQQFCTCIPLFCTFLCLHCTTTTWNNQILSLLGNGNGKAINSNISVRTGARPPLFSSSQNPLLLSKRTN